MVLQGCVCDPWPKICTTSNLSCHMPGHFGAQILQKYFQKNDSFFRPVINIHIFSRDGIWSTLVPEMKSKMVTASFGLNHVWNFVVFRFSGISIGSINFSLNYVLLNRFASTFYIFNTLRLSWYMNIECCSLVYIQ